MKKILIPCDFSDTSDNALQYAVEMAHYFSAHLILLHINQLPVMSPEVSLITQDSLKEANESSLDVLKNLAQKIKFTHPMVGTIDYYSEIGAVEDVVSEFNKKLHVDLIVMGISGHGSSLAKALIGSASVSVAQGSETPVIIVPPGVAFKPIQRVAYACEYDRNMEYGLSLTKVNYFNTVFGSELFIVHVLEKGHELDPQEIQDDHYMERRLDNSPHRTFILNESKVSQSLLSFIKNNSIDLIVVEPKKHSFFHRLFNESVTNELAFNSPVPVMAIH